MSQRGTRPRLHSMRPRGLVLSRQLQVLSGPGASEDVQNLSHSCSLFQAFFIDRTGRKKLMGYGYLLMGVTMCGLTVTLSIKVNQPPPAPLPLTAAEH